MSENNEYAEACTGSISNVRDWITRIINASGFMEALEHCSEAEATIQEIISKRKFGAEDLAKAFDKVIYELSFAVSVLSQEFMEVDEKIRWCNVLANI